MSAVAAERGGDRRRSLCLCHTPKAARRLWRRGVFGCLAIHPSRSPRRPANGVAACLREVRKSPDRKAVGLSAKYGWVKTAAPGAGSI